MKKIFYTYWKGDGHQPFWMPWGCLGCLGRTLLFLLLLFLFFMLLSLFVKCDGKKTPGFRREGLPEEILTPVDDTDEENEEADGYYDPEADTVRDSNTGDKDEIEEEVSEPDKNNGGSSGDIGKDSRIGMIPSPGPNLPAPEKNLLPPVEEDEIIDDDRERKKIVANRLNVILDSDANDETFKLFAQKFKEAYPDNEYQITYYNTLTKLLQLTVPAAQRELVKKELPGKIPDISFKVFDETMFEGALSEKPGDVGFKYQNLAWYFEPIQTYDAWEITQGSSDVVVAIVDSYFDMTHKELEHERIVSPYSVRFRGRDVRPTRDCPQDSPAFFHGTAVAAQAVGTINNGVGLCGIAPQCKLMPVSMGHQFTSMTMLEGILYSIYQGADVVNISAGANCSELVRFLPISEQIKISKMIGKDEEAVWQYVFDLADARNVTIVWASGNSTIYSGLDFSKRGKNTIRVAAVDQNLRRAEFSNFGNFEDMDLNESTVSAPGTAILSASPFNSFGIGDGTSYSAPIVAGAVALMKSIDPTLSNRQIIDILQKTGKSIKYNPEIGPLLQIKDALLMVKKQFTKFDDIMNNHDLLVGTWQTTELLNKVENGVTHPKSLRVFFQIKDENAGEVKILESTTTKNVYSAPLDVAWKEKMIQLNQTQEATSSVAKDKYVAYIFTCKPDKEGYLKCEHVTDSVVSQYYVKKISNNPNINVISYE